MSSMDSILNYLKIARQNVKLNETLRKEKKHCPKCGDRKYSTLCSECKKLEKE